LNVKRIHSFFLLRELVGRDLRARYAGSLFGPAWAVVNPLIWVVLYSFVFSVVLRIRLTGEPAGVTFPLFLLAGFLPWLAIQEGISRSSTALSDNAQMVKKTVFPREALVATVVITATVNEAIALVLFCGYLAIVGQLDPRWALAALPLLAIQVALAYGIGCVLACLNVFFRDTAQVIGLALAMLSFLTPIFYPAAAVPARFRWVISVNPFAHLVEAFRDALLRHRAPAAGSMAYLLGFAVVAVVLGSALFSRTESHFADLL
jgi:lipopolysaccharide transport system permease protein